MRVSHGWQRVGRVAYFVAMTLLTATIILFFIYGAVALAGRRPHSSSCPNSDDDGSDGTCRSVTSRVGAETTAPPDVTTRPGPLLEHDALSARTTSASSGSLLHS